MPIAHQFLRVYKLLTVNTDVCFSMYHVCKSILVVMLTGLMSLGVYVTSICDVNKDFLQQRV